MVRSILATAVGACEMLRSRCGLGFLWSVWLCVWVALELFEDGFLGGGRFLTCEYFAGILVGVPAIRLGRQYMFV